MKIKLTLILLAGVITISTFNKVKAQTPSPAAIKSAEQLLIAAGADAMIDKSVKTMIAQYSAQMPADKKEKFVKVMNEFMSKYFSWNLLKHDMCEMYAREFTEPEMKQLTTFYKTPLGIKLNQKQPILMQKGMAMGQQRVMEHQAELQKMMADAMK